MNIIVRGRAAAACIDVDVPRLINRLRVCYGKRVNVIVIFCRRKVPFGTVGRSEHLLGIIRKR